MRSRLGIRSAYSLLYGVARPEELAARAASYGASALSVTDRDNLYGVHSIIAAAKEAGLRPVIGAELTAARSLAGRPRGASGSQDAPGSRGASGSHGASGSRDAPGTPPPKAGSVFAFVRDRTGFARLCELLTLAKSAAAAAGGAGVGVGAAAGGTPFDLCAALRKDAAGLVLATGDPELLAALADRVPTLYAAVTPRSLRAVSPARALGIPLIALDDATFLDTDDFAVHAVLRAVALGKTVGSFAAEGDRAAPDELFLPAPEFERRLASWPEALRATDEVADACRFDTVFDGFVFPGYAPGDGAEPADPVDPAADPADPAADQVDPAATLRRRVIDGAEERYGELSDAIAERIDYELDIIERKGFSPYFLVMDDIVSMASRTCGRGSGAASIVSYALSITNVDPIAHKLYFERFLNMARQDPPDIDVDFAWDERDELIKRVIARFGADRCARVANHNTFRPRSALRETAKAYGLADGEISRMERILFEIGEGSGTADPLWTEIRSIARRIEGLPRGLSMHCGGLVITPGPIRRYAPIEASAEGYPLLAWEKEGTEAAGLVKIDLLGNRSLAVIRDALANLEEQGIRVDTGLWRPAEDEATVAALARGDSLGVFYIESPAMRQLQKKTGKGDFEHIVIHSSIIRPAANKFISEYVRRLKGGAWEPLHPRLAYILDETYGILCYQEDVSKTAVALAGFNEADADKLRKVIAKKAGAAKLAEYEERFFSGCRANGVLEGTIKEVWAMMLSFDGYSFCKPHSASYAMVSFQSAWLRVHHPAPFMAAVLSNQGGYYRPQAYVSEARRMGLTVVGPDANRSRYRYRGEGSELVVGLMAIAKLSRTAADALLAERDRRGPFADLPDFSRRLRLSRDDLVSLTAAGVFDSLSAGRSRALQARALLFAAGAAGSTGSAGSADRGGGQGGQGALFAAEKPAPFLAPAPAPPAPFLDPAPAPPASGGPNPPTPAPPAPALAAIAPAPADFAIRNARRSENELHEEYAALGFLRDRHPLSLWSASLARVRRVLARDLSLHVGSRIGLVGWPVTQKEVWTKDGLAMNFVSFEDETALFETVLFPEVYDRYRTLLFDQRPLLLFGKVADDQGALSVELERVGTLEGTALEEDVRKSAAPGIAQECPRS